MKKQAHDISTGEVLVRGDRLYTVRSVARVTVSGLSVTASVNGQRIDVPIPDTDTIRVWCEDGSQFSIPAAETVMVL